MKPARIKLLVGLALAVPGLLMVRDAVAGDVWPMDLLHPTGELCLRLIVLALLPGPLVELFGSSRFLRGWLSFRRSFGLAGFGYGALHLAFYAADMTPAGILAELSLPGIWTGWLALVLLSVPASISFNAAVRILRRNWKRLQSLVYPAFLVGLVHWLLLAWSPWPAFIHAVPVAAVWAARTWKRKQIRKGTPQA